MAVNPQFLVAAVDLSEVFVDKDTGQPLSGGIVSFFQDSDHVTPKLVYTIQNQNPALPPNYTYVPLPNPITLSSTGQFQDNNGNNIPVYYYPVDAAGNLQLYYITVTSSSGVQQFTRQGWPPNEGNGVAPPGAEANAISNQLSNPQFIYVNFIPALGLSFTYAGAAIDTIALAPDWNLVIDHTGPGTITVTRTAVQGSSAYPFNPPYTLTVTPGVNIASLQLIQTLPNNPDVFSPSLLSTNGYLSGSILLAPNSVASLSYRPNGQAAQLILNANNNTGAYAQFNNTVRLTPASNPATGDTGFVDIIIGLNIAIPTTFSNVQVIPLNTNIANIQYDQTTANRQIDQLFNYYNSLLQFKPIPSFLIGWDFALNPAQEFGINVVAFGTGANTSNYVWDNTIVFQSANNGFTTSQGTSGAIRLTAAVNTQLALIQYISGTEARNILFQRLCAMIESATNGPAFACTISLWATTGAALPNIAAGASLVATLDANGKPATFNLAGGQPWVEVTRSNLGDARFNVAGTAKTDFRGWESAALANTTTFFAIVVGTGQILAGNNLSIQSISLQMGDIPTIPGAQTKAQVQQQCERFYQKSFAPATAPAQAVGANTGDTQGDATGQVGNPMNGPLYIFLKTQMNTVPAITLFNPVNANAQLYDYNIGADFSATVAANISTKGFNVTGTSNGATGLFDRIGIHWIANSRLGF